MLGWEVIPRIPLGDFSVSPHGVGIAIGYFIGASLLARRARRTGFDEDHAWNAAVVGVLGAIVGARTAYVVGHSDQFDSPIEYLQVYRGGISLVGGLMGGFLAAWIYARAKKLDFPRLADLGAPGLAIGTAVGRIGDLVIGDHLGKPTDGFWGWRYEGGELISSPPCLQGGEPVYPSPNGCIEPGMVVHQTALYDAVWALVIFFFLMRLDRSPRPKGFLIWTWAALYAAGRIVTDFTRVDKTWFGTGLTGSQLTAIAALLLAVLALGRLRRATPATAAAAVTEGAGAPDGAAAASAATAGVAAAATGGPAVTGTADAGEVDQPPVADEAAGTGSAENPAEAGDSARTVEVDTTPAPQEPPVADEAAGSVHPAPPAQQEPPVADESAGAAKAWPAAMSGGVRAEHGPSPTEQSAGAPEPQPAPVLVPDAAIGDPPAGGGAAADAPEAVPEQASIVEREQAAGEPVTADPAVQGERVAEGKAEPPAAPEAVPALEPVLDADKPADADPPAATSGEKQEPQQP